MTDRMAALARCRCTTCRSAQAALDDFYRALPRRSADHRQMVRACRPSIPEPARSTASSALTAHPAFSMANPNRVRSLIGAFAQGNQTQFNRADGAGYDSSPTACWRSIRKNPQVAARMTTAFRAGARSSRPPRAAPRRRCGASPQRQICRATSATSCSARSLERLRLSPADFRPCDGRHALKTTPEFARRANSHAAEFAVETVN